MMIVAGAKTTKTMVRWDESEWEKLADQVAKMRVNDPGPSIGVLFTGAMAQWPKDRQRQAQQPLLDKLLRMVTERLRASSDAIREIASLRHKIETLSSRPSREDAIASLTQQEIVARFKAGVLRGLTAAEICEEVDASVILDEIDTALLIGTTASRMWTEAMSRSQHGDVLAAIQGMLQVKQPAATKPVREVLPKIALVGFKSAQASVVDKALCGRARIIGIDKNQCGMPIAGAYNRIVMWKKFVSHATQEQVRIACNGDTKKLRIWGGGLSELIDTLARDLT